MKEDTWVWAVTVLSTKKNIQQIKAYVILFFMNQFKLKEICCYIVFKEKYGKTVFIPPFCVFNFPSCTISRKQFYKMSNCHKLKYRHSSLFPLNFRLFSDILMTLGLKNKLYHRFTKIQQFILKCPLFYPEQIFFYNLSNYHNELEQ